MTLGRCNDCGGAAHPYAVYEWKGVPLLRDALCPLHRTPLDQTTRPRDSSRVRQQRPRNARIERAKS